MKLAVLISHPIQYYTPIFRALAAACDLHVFYGQRLTAAQQAKTGFNEAFDWDIDLLSGYASTTLRNVSQNPGPAHFLGCDTPEIGTHLRRGKFDALVVAGWYLKCHAQAVLAAKWMGLPVLVRGDSHLDMPDSAVKRRAKGLLFPPFLRLFDGALFVGQKSKDFYHHYRFPAQRLFFSPHCVDNDWFSARATAAARRQLRESLGVDEHAFLALFAGKLVPFKRPLDVVEAAAKCRSVGRNVHVMVAGSGELDPDMRRCANDAGVKLHMLGFRNQTQMPGAYAASDALVLPSSGRETWGLVANEALACGKPIIVSEACGCAPDLAADGTAGRVVPHGDTEAIASAIAGIMDKPLLEFDIRARADRYSVARAADGIITGVAGVRKRNKNAEFI